MSMKFQAALGNIVANKIVSVAASPIVLRRRGRSTVSSFGVNQQVVTLQVSALPIIITWRY